MPTGPSWEHSQDGAPQVGRADQRLSFPPDAVAVGSVRRFVAKWLSNQGLQAWTAVQLASELAANAVDHAGTEFAVLIGRRGDRVRVEVSDGAGLMADTTEAKLDSSLERGRGLFLVDALSVTWGIEERPGGKAVYFEAGAAPLDGDTD
jgi:anti-sigma regulatory factor (Ser/Thr protein kinase)